MITRVSKINRLLIETPDRNSCDVFRQCPPQEDSTGHTVLSVVVGGPSPLHPGQLRTITVTLDTPVAGAPLEIEFMVPAGVDNPPQTVIVAIQPGQTAGVATPQNFRAPFNMFSGALLTYPAGGVPENPRIISAPPVTNFPGAVPYELVGITVNNDEVLQGQPVTYTATIDAPNAMSTPLAFVLTLDGTGYPISIAPGQNQGSVTVTFDTPGIKIGLTSSPPAQLDDNGIDPPDVTVN